MTASYVNMRVTVTSTALVVDALSPRRESVIAHLKTVFEGDGGGGFKARRMPHIPSSDNLGTIVEDAPAPAPPGVEASSPAAHIGRYEFLVYTLLLLGKVEAPKRTGGGFARLNTKSAHGSESLGDERVHLHNLETRYRSLDLRQRGPNVPPPQAHGLKTAANTSSATALWPDAQLPPNAPRFHAKVKSDLPWRDPDDSFWTPL